MGKCTWYCRIKFTVLFIIQSSQVHIWSLNPEKKKSFFPHLQLMNLEDMNNNRQIRKLLEEDLIFWVLY